MILLLLDSIFNNAHNREKKQYHDLIICKHKINHLQLLISRHSPKTSLSTLAAPFNKTYSLNDTTTSLKDALHCSVLNRLS